MEKETAVSRLLGTAQQSKNDKLGSAKSSPLIVDLNADNSHESNIEDVPVDGGNSTTVEEPTMLELMMEAQRAAKREKEEVRSAAAVKEPLAKGFKKGFLSSKKTSTNSKVSNPTVAPVKASSSTGSMQPGDTSNSEPVLIKKSANTDKSQQGLVFDEVQRAMEEDKHPLLQQLQNNEWVTPDLMSTMQSNEVLSRGLRDPQCMAAMQLMQNDPQEAKRRFEGNPHVAAFLQEFGKVMAAHFEALGKQTAAGNNSTSNSSNGEGSGSSGGIQEIGPLQAKAIERAARTKTADTTTNAGTGSKKELVTSKSGKSAQATTEKAKQDEEARVQKILQDEELRSMLMDPALQQILVECGDPAKFQQHMRNPETARKIMKLQQSGLVSQQR